MVGDDSDGVCGPLEVLAPFFQSKNNSEEFPVVDVVVTLGR